MTGERIQVFLNGTKINDYVDSDPNRMNAPTLIGLQNHGTGDDVFFRNVQIKELADAVLAGAVADRHRSGGRRDRRRRGDRDRHDRRREGDRSAPARPRARSTPSGGAFSASIPLALGAEPDQRVRVQRRRRRHERVAQRVLALVRDARRRAERPGRATTTGRARTATRPTASTPRASSTSQNVEVYTEGDNVRFVTRIRGAITNQFGGDQISHQRINVYLGAGAGSPVAAMPGTNMDVGVAVEPRRS